MPPPLSIGHIHVHALRLASGAETLVARVLSVDGVAGFGFSFGPEAFPARDMAAWDAAARSRAAPLYALFGKKTRARVAIVRKESGNGVIDPFGDLLENVRPRVRSGDQLLASNSHPWELSYCAALAATLAGEVKIAVSEEIGLESVDVPETPGIAIDWLLEPAFATLRWVP